MTNKEKSGGLIKMIIVIIIAILILSYFGIDLKNFINSDQVQKNLGYAWGIVVKIWDLFIDYIWHPIVSLLSSLLKK